jgi:hypothetical protein|nr:brassinosteroid-responsive RING protein 1-like [Lolium perenne]
MALSCSDLVLRRNLLALQHLLEYVRFVAAVVLDRLGIVSLKGEMLPEEPWTELMDTAAMERLMEAAFREPSSSRMNKRSSVAPQHRRQRVASAGDGEADDDDVSEAICAICMSGLEDVGGHLQVAVLRNCSHAFHAACIESWIAGGETGTCPLCRTPTLPTAWSGWHEAVPRMS